MDSFIETFHIDWMTILAQTINFIIVLFVLNFLAIKPLKKIMADRTANIEKGLDDAKKNAETLKNTEKEYELIISKARKEAQVIFENGKNEAEAKKTEIIEKAKKEVESMIENGKQVLESEKIKILDEAKKDIVNLVVKSTEKILETKGDDDNINNKIISKIRKI